MAAPYEYSNPTTRAFDDDELPSAMHEVSSDSELKASAPEDLSDTQSPQSYQNSIPEPVSSTPVYTFPKVSVLALMTTVLQMFHIEKKSVLDIKDHYFSQGVSLSSTLIRRVIGATTANFNSTGIIDKAQVEQVVAKQMQMLEFMVRLMRNGKSGEEIEQLCTQNDYRPDSVLVKKLAEFMIIYRERFVIE